MTPSTTATKPAPAPSLTAPLPIKILLVDDTPGNLTSIGALLDGLADSISLARSGREALSLILREDFAVVLLDVRMPDMDGFEVATLLRDHPRYSSLPILFISAFEPRREEMEKAYQLGAVDYVTKPISGAILRSKVATFVEISRSRQELERRVQERTQALKESEERLALELAASRQLHNISTQLIQEDSIQALYEQILDAAVGIMRSDFASIQRFHPERGPGGELFLLGYRGFTPQAAELWKWVRPATTTTCGMAIHRGARVVVSDVEDPASGMGPETTAAYLGTGIHAVQSTPLISRRGRLLGMISTHWGKVHAPSDRDLRVFDVLARQAADLVERAATQAALSESEANLALLVEMRTEALSQTVRDLDAFAYTIAHDLRAPLRGVHGCSSLLLEEHAPRLDEEGRDLVNRIAEAGKRMDRLITDLLEYSRLGRQETPLSRLSIRSSVDAALKQMEQELRDRRADVEVSAPLPDAVGHETTLTQAIANLLSNAAKFVAPGVTPRIRIRTERQGPAVRLWVEDNGIGIDPAHFGRVFNVFERLHTSEAYAGTGIGLALVRRVMDRMAGRAGVESVPGSGSRFWIELPAAE